MENPRTRSGSPLCSSSSLDALSTTLSSSIQALGRGFDVTSDIRLLYCKGAPGSRLVQLDEDHTDDLVLSGRVIVPNVSADIKWSMGNGGIERKSVCSFHEVGCRYSLFICFRFVGFLFSDFVCLFRCSYIFPLFLESLSVWF